MTRAPTSDKGTRDIALDAARGVAILLVVAGHIFLAPAKNLIYLFHMPFFFLIGGYLFQAREDFFVIRYLFVRLLVPYFAFLAVISLPEIITAVAKHGSDDVFWRLRRLLLGGEGLVAPLTVFWFPTCYFWTVLIYNYLKRRLKMNTLWAISIGLLGLSTVNQYLAPQFWLPWAINVCAMSIPLFHIGAAWGHYIFNPSSKLNIIFLIVSIGYFCAILYFDAPPMAMKRADYGIPFVTLLAAVACCAVLAGVARYTTRFSAPTALLAFCGNASMTIMYVHMPAQMVFFNNGLQATWPRFMLVVAVCLVAHSVFLRFPTTQKVLLGRRSDMKD